MIRFIIKWYAGRLVDDGRPLPWWLRSWLRVDRRSRRVLEESLSLDERLRADAREFAGAETRESLLVRGRGKPAADPRPLRTRRVVFGVTAIAATAILAAAVVWALLPSASDPIPEGGGDQPSRVARAPSREDKMDRDENARMRQKALQLERLVRDTGVALSELRSTAYRNARQQAPRLPSLADGLREDGKALKSALRRVLQRLSQSHRRDEDGSAGSRLLRPGPRREQEGWPGRADVPIHA